MTATTNLDLVFGALSDPIRRAILDRLVRGPATVGELAEPHTVSPAAITKHLKVLERAGLLIQERKGQFRPCRLKAQPISEAKLWLADREAMWNEQFDRLDSLLQAD